MGDYFSKDMEKLNYLLSEIDEVYHDASVRLGVSDSAMRILYTLCIAGDRCPLCDVAKNGRDKLICLTEKGSALTKATAQRVIEIENAIFDGWEKEERKQYFRLLSKYLNDLKVRVEKL